MHPQPAVRQGGGVDLSVIIPVWDRQQELDACLQSLATQTGVSYEAIVVDDGSTPPISQPTTSVPFPTRWLGDGRRRGPYYRRNQGILAATGRCLAFIDSDVQFQDPLLLARVVERLDRDPGIGSLGGEIPVHDRSRSNGHNLTLSWYAARSYVEPGATRECDYVPTCFCCCRRADAVAVGGFDPFYQFGGGDADFGLTLRRRLGKRNEVGFSFSVFHNASSSGRRPDMVQRYCRSRLRLMLKHAGPGHMAAQVAWDALQVGRRAVGIVLSRALGRSPEPRGDLAAFVNAYVWFFANLRRLRGTLLEDYLTEPAMAACAAASDLAQANADSSSCHP